MERPISCSECPFGVCEHEEFWGAIVERWECGTESGGCAYEEEQEEDEDE